MSKKYQNFISGEWVDSSSGETFTNRNPANWEEIVGVFPKLNKEDVDKAVKTASKAYDNWRLVPVPERGEIMKKTGDIMANRKEEIAQLMIFGPVLSVLKASNLAEGIDILNDTTYGLSSSIYTKDINAAYKVLRDIEAGITYVNGHNHWRRVSYAFWRS